MIHFSSLISYSPMCICPKTSLIMFLHIKQPLFRGRHRQPGFHQLKTPGKANWIIMWTIAQHIQSECSRDIWNCKPKDLESWLKEAKLQGLVDRLLHTMQQLDTAVVYGSPLGHRHPEKAICKEGNGAVHGEQERQHTREEKRQEQLLPSLSIPVTQQWLLHIVSCPETVRSKLRQTLYLTLKVLLFLVIK